MLNNYKGSDAVKKGFYASISRWTIELVKTDGEKLPGAADERYIHLPTPIMLVAAPLVGAAFVIFLPLIGFVLLGNFAWHKLTAKPPEATEIRKAA